MEIGGRGYNEFFWKHLSEKAEEPSSSLVGKVKAKIIFTKDRSLYIFSGNLSSSSYEEEDGCWIDLKLAFRSIQLKSTQ